MSRYNHHSNEVTQIIHDISTMEKEDIENVYGIDIDEKTGRVYDSTIKRFFQTTTEWAEFMVEQEKMEYSEQFHHGKMTHDDYY